MITRSENVRRNIINMFTLRKYTDIYDDEKVIRANKSDGTLVYAFPSIIKKLNVAEIHNHIFILQRAQINHGLLVYEGIPTPAVKNVITNTPDIKIHMELFQADNLQFNITEHRLVPVHIRLSAKEAEEFREKYGTSIPVLLRSDAIVRFFDFNKGDIIKIIRRGGFISYRIVR